LQADALLEGGAPVPRFVPGFIGYLGKPRRGFRSEHCNGKGSNRDNYRDDYIDSARHRTKVMQPRKQHNTLKEVGNEFDAALSLEIEPHADSNSNRVIRNQETGAQCDLIGEAVRNHLPTM
jgi:hypothetical protein